MNIVYTLSYRSDLKKAGRFQKLLDFARSQFFLLFWILTVYYIQVILFRYQSSITSNWSLYHWFVKLLCYSSRVLFQKLRRKYSHQFRISSRFTSDRVYESFLSHRLTDTGEDSKLVHRWKRSKVNAAPPRYFLLFSDSAPSRKYSRPLLDVFACIG